MNGFNFVSLIRGRKFFLRAAWIQTTIISLATAITNVNAVVDMSSALLQTSRPTDPVGGLSWDMQVRFGNTSGTMVGPHTFLTAIHSSKGGIIGQAVTYYDSAGQEYTTTIKTWVDEPSGEYGADLRIWVVNGTFPTWAGINTQNSEGYYDCWVMGCGRWKKADAVYKNGQQKGWLSGWFPGTGPLSWSKTRPLGAGGGVVNFDFWDRGNGAAMAVEGDSGGGVLFQDFDGVIKILGVIESSDQNSTIWNGFDDPSKCGFSLLYDRFNIKTGSNTTACSDTWQSSQSGAMQWRTTRIFWYSSWILQHVNDQ